MSRYLASELNNLLGQRRATTGAISLHYDNGNLMVQKDGVLEVLSFHPRGYMPTWDTPEVERTELIIVSPTEISIDAETHEHQMITPFSTASRLLNVRIIESQTLSPWCAAYASAMIIRYLHNNHAAPTAFSLVRSANPGQPNHVLESLSFPDNDVRNAFTSRGWSFSQQNRAFSLSEVQSQIRRGNPIYISTHNTAPRGGRHAFVLRGYITLSNSAALYSMWNPWETFFETTCSTTTRIQARHEVYVWDRTFSGWR